ncbi:MAG TPA: PDZ domain-containing protein [Bacteroidia bacterium]
MKYIISYSQPHRHFVDIELVADKINADETLVQLPAWRPGRYELGNFAKNVQKWAAFDEKGNALAFSKVSKDCWKVQTKGVKELHVKYNYYAAELNAGSTFLDGTQLYMNPVNCCVYLPSRINEECEFELKLPKDYKVACGMKPAVKGAVGDSHRFMAKDFHELADSPFIASNTLQHNMFVLDGVEFHLWFQGECKPDWTKIITDFFIFINEQFLMMKEFPCESYHFLYQALPQKFHHGVEHLTSTVIALGPAYMLLHGETYNEFLGVSSHELFHSWNIKSIRPVEMQPYDYTKENYSRLGYVCEGVTTYYGDFFLFRAGVYSEQEYLKQLNVRLQRHMDNFGRFNLSVADSSYDTWLDGYNSGIPDRKTSIYDEGCLLAFMTDMLIRKHSENRNSLDDVMRYLYFEFAKHNKGYSERDYQDTVEQMAGVKLDEFFNKYVYGANTYESAFREALDQVGYRMVSEPARKYHERHWGIKTHETGGTARVTSLFPGSPADKAGISVNDEIVSVNGFQVRGDGTGTNLSEWSRHFGLHAVEIGLLSFNHFRKVTVHPSSENFFSTYSVVKREDAFDEQKRNFEAWSKRRF